MTYTVGPKGQVVIPKAIRDELGIRPGDQVGVYLEDGQVVVRREEDDHARRMAIVKRLRGSLPGDGSGTRELEASRRRDRIREDRKAGWGA